MICSYVSCPWSINLHKRRIDFISCRRVSFFIRGASQAQPDEDDPEAGMRAAVIWKIVIYHD